MKEKIRSLRLDINRAFFGMGDFAEFESEDIVGNSRFFRRRGLISTDGIKKTRRLNRPFTSEDIREADSPAKDMGIFGALFRLPHSAAQWKQGRRINFAGCFISRTYQSFQLTPQLDGISTQY